MGVTAAPSWKLTHTDAEAIAAQIREQPGWRVVRIALMCGGNYAIETCDPEGCLRYIHSQAEWDWQLRGQRASYEEMTQARPVKLVLGVSVAPKVRQTRRSAPIGQLGLFDGGDYPCGG